MPDAWTSGLSVRPELMVVLSPRSPWPGSFPDVVTHTSVQARDAAPEYLAAKAGDADAAFTLVMRLIDDDATAHLNDVLFDSEPLLIPVVADEAAGFNAIPDALAQILALALNAPVASGGIVQTNLVGHTRAPSFQRIVTPAEFDGPVEVDRNYVLVDDHVGLGGTLANLRGYIMSKGGCVIGMTTLTESRDARTISLQSATRAMLWHKHGQELDRLWQAQFGYGIDCLTEVEAQNLCRQPSVAAIEDFLAKAAVEARGRGLEPAVG